jgi:catechol 2,3-dioxygenase-like lactoylglutathione lyase family enzyme
MAPRLGRTIPALPVRDVEAAAAHYRERFGFEAPHVEPAFALLRRDDAEIHLWGASDDGWAKRDDFVERPVCSGAESFIAGTASCRIEVTGVDRLYNELRTAGVLHGASSEGVGTTEWGTREFHALDRDGNLLTFFERVRA